MTARVLFGTPGVGDTAVAPYASSAVAGAGAGVEQGAAIIILDWRSLVAFLAHGAFALLKNGSIDLKVWRIKTTKSDITIPLFPLWLDGKRRDQTR